MTEAEYKSRIEKDAQVKATKKNFWAKKDPNVETLTEWMENGQKMSFVKLKGKALQPSRDGRNLFGEKVAGFDPKTK